MLIEYIHCSSLLDLYIVFSSESSGGTVWRYHSVKLSKLLAFDCAGIERLSVPQPNLALLLCLTGRADLHCLRTFSPPRACSHECSHSQARRGPTQ